MEIDKALFLSTVPSYPVLDQNYTVQVLVKNNLGTDVPVIFNVVVPFTAAIVHPFSVHITLGPYAQVIGNFTINVFNQLHGAPFNVTAFVWIWYTGTMNTPKMIEQVNTVIYGTVPSTYTPETQLFTAVFITSFVALVLYIIRNTYRSSRMKRETVTTSEPPLAPKT